MELIFLLAALLPALIGAGGMIASNVATNDANKQAVEETNKANKEIQEQANLSNLQAVRETNASNVQQAELSYQRSLPVNQVRDLMNAGMSKVGALQKLAGGGSYTAPALSAGQVQASNMQAPHFDYSAIGDALDRLGNIPSNVLQFHQVQEQINSARLDSSLKIKRDLREQEQHEFDMWQKNYGKKAAELIDSFGSKIANIAAEKGISLDSIDSVDKLVKSFDLSHDQDWLSMPSRARNEVINSLRLQANENRANNADERARVASDDAHRLSLLEEDMKKFNFNEQQRTQIYRINLLAQQVQEGKLTLDRENYEKALRDVGFKDKKDAAAALATAEKFKAQESENNARNRYHASDTLASPALVAIDWCLERVNPLKALINL